jgi:PD-(D/E)XK endonuclease
VLTTDQKGNIAEVAITLAALRLGIDVYRPIGEGGRYDLILDLAGGLSRVQCKWACRRVDVVIVRCYSSRRNRHGLLRRIYAEGEIDAFAAYCEGDRSVFPPALRRIRLPGRDSPTAQPDEEQPSRGRQLGR